MATRAKWALAKPHCYMPRAYHRLRAPAPGHALGAVRNVSSESERRRVMDAVDSLRQKDARDELGLGAVRDGFADLLFPGTGTVQTRARYFLFVPWIYQELEAKGAEPAEVPRLARQVEIDLIDALEAGGERDGLIGFFARKTLKRLPSNIYWQGLQTWRICQFAGSQDDFHRSLRRRTNPETLLKSDDGELAVGARRGPWHAGLPVKATDFPRKAKFALTQGEAEYLRERVLTTASGTLLAFLIREDARWKPVDFPWEHPSFGSFPDELKIQLGQAQRLSETMHGAPLLYNLLLSEKSKNEERIGEYRKQLEEWRRALPQQQQGAWPDATFWEMAARSGRTISQRTQAFVRDWVLHVADVIGGAPPDAPAARHLVARRELEVKGSRKARLHSESALLLWNGAAGLARLEYRWRNAQRVLLDIHLGLSGRSGNA